MSTTVTIEKSYLDALLLRADLHTSVRDSRFPPDLSNDIVISKTEHDRLVQAFREYNILKNALLRGGLTTETLQTLLEEESDTTAIVESRKKPTPTDARRRTSFQRAGGSERHETVGNMNDDGNEARRHSESNLHHDRRTILITNLPEGTTHKELTSIIRGGRLLDIFLRNDRSAQVSFVEGASDFLAYGKRHDIYLHTKRLDCRWADRQFHVPNHISNKIAGGASRNLVIRSGATKFSPEEIRDHLDHIHNLVVIDVHPLEGDLYISTNSIHNALFARTCMMSRSPYKGLRVEFHPDECAARLPLPPIKPRTAEIPVKVSRNLATANVYALLDTESDLESESDDNFCTGEGIRIDRHKWSEAAVA